LEWLLRFSEQEIKLLLILNLAALSCATSIPFMSIVGSQRFTEQTGKGGCRHEMSLKFMDIYVTDYTFLTWFMSQ
jgi:hypothetical protein